MKKLDPNLRAEFAAGLTLIPEIVKQATNGRIYAPIRLRDLYTAGDNRQEMEVWRDFKRAERNGWVTLNRDIQFGHPTPSSVQPVVVSYPTPEGRLHATLREIEQVYDRTDDKTRKLIDASLGALVGKIHNQKLFGKKATLN
jgi:hypothetical protein